MFRAIANPFTPNTHANLNSIKLTKEFLDKHGINNYGQLARHLLRENGVITFGAFPESRSFAMPCSFVTSAYRAVFRPHAKGLWSAVVSGTGSL